MKVKNLTFNILSLFFVFGSFSLNAQNDTVAGIPVNYGESNIGFIQLPPVFGPEYNEITQKDYCYPSYRHSFCHGRASGPTSWLTENVLGITIAEPGCKTLKIEPHLGNLQWDGKLSLGYS